MKQQRPKKGGGCWATMEDAVRTLLMLSTRRRRRWLVVLMVVVSKGEGQAMDDGDDGGGAAVDTSACVRAPQCQVHQIFFKKNYFSDSLLIFISSLSIFLGFWERMGSQLNRVGYGRDSGRKGFMGFQWGCGQGLRDLDN